MTVNGMNENKSTLFLPTSRLPVIIDQSPPSIARLVGFMHVVQLCTNTTAP
jgi:hypothetical protein